MAEENILLELAVAGTMVIVTVLIHGVGLVSLARLLRLEAREEAEHHLGPTSFRGIVTTVGIVLGLFLLHAIGIGAYGLLYVSLGAVTPAYDAMYFSAMTYGTLGYSDSLLSDNWRLVAAIEGINGLLLIGWSTAFFVTMMGRLNRV